MKDFQFHHRAFVVQSWLFFASLVPSSICLASATVSLKAVARNGAPVTPTNAITVAQNDTITAEVYFSGWGTPPFDAPTNTGLVQTFQATLLGAAGAVSNGSDGTNNAELILPHGWDAPVVKDNCPCGDHPDFGTCDPLYGCIHASRCVGGSNAFGSCTMPSHCPGGTCDAAHFYTPFMGSLNTARSDWIFSGFNSFQSMDISTLNFRWAGTINHDGGQMASRCQGGPNSGTGCWTSFECGGAPCNQDFLSYAGTLNLKAGAEACGTFTFNFRNEVASTFVSNPELFPIMVLPDLEGLTVTVTGANCPCAADSLLPDPSAIGKARFLSFSTAIPDCVGALRVRMRTLHHVEPPYSGSASVPFTENEGEVRWVGPPTRYFESTSNATPFYASQLQCTPHYQDWSTVGLLHVTGSAIVPSSRYDVEKVESICMGTEEDCTAVSVPLAVTTTRWGDVSASYNPPSETAQPDLGDLAALVDKFRSGPGAPIKVRGLLAGADEFGTINNLNKDLGFEHIAACVDAFGGSPYPYTIQGCP